MNFAVFNREKDLSTLADRLFVIEGGPAETAKAVAALLKANPHLSDLKKVPHGTLIVVPNSPDIPPVRVSETTDAGPETHKHLKLALKEFDNVIDRSLASEGTGKKNAIVAALYERRAQRRSPGRQAQVLHDFCQPNILC